MIFVIKFKSIWVSKVILTPKGIHIVVLILYTSLGRLTKRFSNLYNGADTMGAQFKNITDSRAKNIQLSYLLNQGRESRPSCCYTVLHELRFLIEAEHNLLINEVLNVCQSNV